VSFSRSKIVVAIVILKYHSLALEIPLFGINTTPLSQSNWRILSNHVICAVTLKKYCHIWIDYFRRYKLLLKHFLLFLEIKHVNFSHYCILWVHNVVDYCVCICFFLRVLACKHGEHSFHPIFNTLPGDTLGLAYLKKHIERFQRVLISEKFGQVKWRYFQQISDSNRRNNDENSKRYLSATLCVVRLFCFR